MKKLLTTSLFALLFLPVLAGGGKDKYIKAMKETLGMMDTAKSVSALQNCANRFERIGNAEKKEWLPFYYVSLSYVTMCMLEQDVEKKDPILDKAQEYVEKAADLVKKDKDKAEVVVLEGMILSSRIQVEPQTRGMQYGPQSAMKFAKAASIDPDNPRAMSMKGQNTLFTPKQFGGGKEKAIPILEEAVAKFESFKAQSEIHPTWGKDNAVQMLKIAKGELKPAWMEEMEKMEEGGTKEGGEEKEHDHDHDHDHGDENDGGN